tara:strand:+ start:12493 stop:12870 length:378 start_codon:yes stop_codon:yes gene_type:complete
MEEFLMISPATKVLLSTFFLILSVKSSDLYASDLNAYVRTNYPANIRTVGQLAEYIIDGTGYKIYNGKNAPDDASSILHNTLPHQPSGLVLSRKDALLIAIGQKNSLVVDYENKLVSMTRNPHHE